MNLVLKVKTGYCNYGNLIFLSQKLSVQRIIINLLCPVVLFQLNCKAVFYNFRLLELHFP